MRSVQFSSLIFFILGRHGRITKRNKRRKDSFLFDRFFPVFENMSFWDPFVENLIIQGIKAYLDSEVKKSLIF